MNFIISKICLLLLYIVSIKIIKSDVETHEYKVGEPVIVWVNKIGPYNNPQETYTYNTLPFCKAPNMKEPKSHALAIGEILDGNELFDSGHNLMFATNKAKTVLCSQILNKKMIDTFTNAIKEHYWYQMNVDDLPIWGLVGKISKDDTEFMTGTPLLYTHKKFSISYNGPNIIHVNLSYAEIASSLDINKEIEFTYEVEWKKTDVTFDDRFNRYLEDEFFEHQIHWFSIFNSFMMVIFLCGLVLLILTRTLKNDYARFTMEDNIHNDDFENGLLLKNNSHSLLSIDETGWKQIHGDVFRQPWNLPLYCALIGSGVQLLIFIFLIILITIFSSLYVEPGGIISVGITCYAISSFVSGYVSGFTYYQYFYPNLSPDWIKTMLLSATLLPFFFFFILFFINWIAVIYGTTYAIPILIIIKIIFLWAFVSFPLAIIGTLLGRHSSFSRPNFPCRINSIHRAIPETKWYLKPNFLILLTGILPFGSIFIEMYFVFTSFWNYKFYYVYGFMLLVFFILIIVSLCVTIVTTYFLLNSENYKWHWTSFLASGSTAFYVFLYSIYFYYYKTKMYGFLQATFYFGYMGLFCTAFFIMCGTLGYIASNIFTKRIYRNIKCE